MAVHQGLYPVIYIRPLILNVYRDVGEKNKAGKEVAGCLWRELASIVSSYC